ncbi:hypothetical protein LEP1GSC193_1255 [Leptospira alstonii serovar Pingchang str. 80-412]|uniref:Adenylate/guanylate cyclase catalytic domain protein n=2 Tax=Leptospira alstonii TaxID=28452 RepID=M6DIH4_9LEPT|nr:hypothetical protein LEP1GSC194_0922 [Leptospira alstonii serovar Sichuan str. 79601]EQA82551.1 hypothetical protein LEP1GSC193_1255 [Leptospira alstonii serovar Pingchang str. 80-412]
MSVTTPFSSRKVILFLSVDIVGSTEYKNKAQSQNHWLRFFTTFYEEFPITFLNQIEANSSLFQNLKLPLQKLWKSLGDELIFECEIKKHQEVQYLVKAFSQAVFNYSYNIKDKNLSLKGCAWIAGFPVINAMITSDSNGNETKDYIGPQIDIGFRISKFATELKFVISVEVLILLARTTNTHFKFYLEEPRPLKGVLSNKPYPIIWIKNEKSKEMLLNQLLNKHGNPTRSEELNAYCLSFLYESGKPFMPPFLENDPSNQIGMRKNSIR